MEFPRDIQLLIVKKLDIESRSKLGIIWKLRVPIAFRKELERTLQMRHISRRLSGVVLGGGKYSISIYCSNTQYPHGGSYVRMYIVHDDGSIRMGYAYNDAKKRWDLYATYAPIQNMMLG